jgi:hypothetical protein
MIYLERLEAKITMPLRGTRKGMEITSYQYVLAGQTYLLKALIATASSSFTSKTV